MAMQVEHAISDGYDVRSFLYWTLVDNFEVCSAACASSTSFRPSLEGHACQVAAEAPRCATASCTAPCVEVLRIDESSCLSVSYVDMFDQEHMFIGNLTFATVVYNAEPLGRNCAVGVWLGPAVWPVRVGPA